jgi:calcineurin-like phosphoesterase family protein
MARWFTSDLHLGHGNVIGFCDRPARDATHMNSLILDALNDAAGPDDELWVIGDMAMGDLDRTLASTRRLTAGRLILVAGNHDRVHPYAAGEGTPKQARWLEQYRSASRIDQIHTNGTVLTLAGGLVVDVNHFPRTNPNDEPRRRADGTIVADKFARWRPVDTGRPLLCGHVHEKWLQRGNMLNVGIDANGGRPISEDDAVALLTYPADRAARRWQ